MGLDEAVLLGRADERAVLDRLLVEARAGRGAVKVIRGEAGVGKTALLRYCRDRATSAFQLHTTVGVQSEMQLPYASLHQLCRSLLVHLDSLPAPQRGALGVALGLVEGPPPNPFLVSLATLNLMSEAAAHQPILCVIDDAQWLDSASSQALGFVARRLLADSVAMVFAVREPTSNRELDDLPELRLDGLPDDDARVLLASVIRAPLDVDVRNRLLAEMRGNPLALLELPRRLDSKQLPGLATRRGTKDLAERIEDSFVDRLAGLSRDARLLLLLAAAEPGDDPLLLWKAAKRLGIDVSSRKLAASDGLLSIDGGVRFRHPLVRSAVYRSADPIDRRAAHLALAHETDAVADPDRRAWHLAAAAVGPDEAVASELEKSAGRARARGGLSAAAAFLRRSVALTENPSRRAERALAAAHVSLHAAEYESALDLLESVRSGSLDELQQARAELLRAQIVSASGALGQTPALLLAAAERLEPLDMALARDSYLDAWGAALFAGSLANANMRDVSRVVRSRPIRPPHPHASDLLLESMSVLMTDGREPAAPLLRHAIERFLAEELPVDKGMRWSVIASIASLEIWDFESRDAVLTRFLRMARQAGALAPLAFALNGNAITAAWTGDFEAAARLCAEAEAVTEATGSRVPPFGGMLFAALRGQESVAVALMEGNAREANASGAGFGLQWAQWTTAMLYNSLGRYEEALRAAQRAWDLWPDWSISIFAAAELIEAAARLGRSGSVLAAHDRLLASADVGGTDWGAGIAARSTALLTDGADAEAAYRRAIQHLESTRLKPEIARAHLVYGEWLRREQRRIDAREHLQTAHAMFAEMRSEGFADRARHELLATGVVVGKRAAVDHEELTSQEAHIAQLAADGHTNVEIGAKLYLSPRTVEWHLKKVFLKLGISSRRALRSTLRNRPQELDIEAG